MLKPYLAIVECSRHGKIVDIPVCAGGHLRLLDRADAALGMQDDHGHVLLAPKTVDCGGSSLICTVNAGAGGHTIKTYITARRTDDCQMMSIC